MHICIYLHIYIHICIYIYIYIYIYILKYFQICRCIYTNSSACLHVQKTMQHAQTHTRKRTHTNAQTHLRTYIYKFTLMYTYINIYTLIYEYVNICIYEYKHTHKIHICNHICTNFSTCCKCKYIQHKDADTQTYKNARPSCAGTRSLASTLFGARSLVHRHMQ